MNPPTSNPVVVITGAAGGLGRALVDAFARAGWQVVATWHRSTFTAPQSATIPVWPRQLDVTRPAEVGPVFEQVWAQFGRLDALINNAGIARDSLVAHLSAAAWQEVLEVNLKGAFLCSQAALRPMLEQRAGHIVNIASFGGRVGRAGQANYAASKAGLLGLTQALARESGPHNVQVNAVLPGFLHTPLVGTLTEEQLATHAASNTLGRLNNLDEVARFVAFLAQMKNVSGQLFQLDSRIAPWS
jgi:3-oxoacyl-[acyl-carrier protein] reductase